MFKQGDKVKVPFGDPSNKKFKHGTFIRYQATPRGETGTFIHDKTGKVLQRPAAAFLPERECGVCDQPTCAGEAAHGPQQINWSATREEVQLINKIVDRYAKLYHASTGKNIDRVNVMMDLTACHLNGTPLDLEKLLSFPEFDFAHDIVGIANHINRRNGKIEHCFLPRSYKGSRT